MEWGAICFSISFFLIQRSNLHLLSPAWQADSLPPSHLGSPNNVNTLNANKKENEWGLWGKAIISQRLISHRRTKTHLNYLLWPWKEEYLVIFLNILFVSNRWTVNFHMFKLVLEKAEEPEVKLPTSAGSSESKGVPEKHLFLLHWLCQSLWLCGSQETM